MSVELNSAIWDKRPKTKFLTVQGTAWVEAAEDTIEVSIAEPQGINEMILLIDVKVVPSNQPKKPQPKNFEHQFMTIGDEPWTHIQVSGPSDDEPTAITVLE